MITDGNGNVLAGGERGGKSHITYKPYGEILRTDSYGPDITKFKYTGQEEDKESGLYYYKARYYDAALGRFASNDGQVFPDKEQGMNRMIYVEGNPIRFTDDSGNSTNYMHMLNRIIGHAMGKKFGDKGGSFSSNKIWKGINNYQMYNKLFGKFDKWYGRVIGRNKYSNTSNFHLNLVVAAYSTTDDCKEKFGKVGCMLIYQLNGIQYENSKFKYETNTDPFKGMWDWKIKPDSESSDTVENDSAKVICLNYFAGRSGNHPTDQDYAAAVTCSFTTSSSNSMPSPPSNDGFLGR
ncbi:RHS repeat-associated core domain-containing protein [Leptospira sp. 96542]|nr:RHS repeat-associated core domain-containing protein [Leptospira sp. 96542]